jgi:hypothetical protein
VFVQRVALTVESNTACSLFKSCQRTAYAAQVSAMQSPAGFLTFQGANSIEDATQLIEIKFTNNKTKGLYLDDLDPCDLPLNKSYKGFDNLTDCSCNNCDLLCSGGDIYTPTPVMQGFNYVLVGSVWGGVLLISTLVTILRQCRQRKRLRQ